MGDIPKWAMDEAQPDCLDVTHEGSLMRPDDPCPQCRRIARALVRVAERTRERDAGVASAVHKDALRRFHESEPFSEERVRADECVDTACEIMTSIRNMPLGEG